MRPVLLTLVFIAVANTQFLKFKKGLFSTVADARTTRRPSSTSSTTRHFAWIRNKVTRVQEWAGFRRSTVPMYRTTTVNYRFRTTTQTYSSRERGWGFRTTQSPVIHKQEHPDQGFLDKMKSKLGFVPIPIPLGIPSIPSIHHSDQPDVGFLDRMKAKLGIGSGGTLVSSTTVSPDSTVFETTTTKRPLIDRVKDKLGLGTSTVSSTTVSPDHDTTDPSITTTRKSLIDRAKEKFGFGTTVTPTTTTTVLPPPDEPGFFGRAFAKIKSMLNIGSTDPAKPNLVVKYGKKAVEKLAPKLLEKIKKNFHGMSSYFSTDEEFPTQLQNFEGRTQTDIRQLKEKVEKLEKLVEGLQSVLLKEWNVTESGSKYRLFEERKNWDNAETHCQGFGAHLAIIDNEVKNNFVRNLLNVSETSDFAWIGMKTKTTTQSSTFTNFDSESPIDGCAVIDSKGVWMIRSCIQLRPFVCQIVKNTVDI